MSEQYGKSPGIEAIQAVKQYNQAIEADRVYAAARHIEERTKESK